MLITRTLHPAPRLSGKPTSQISQQKNQPRETFTWSKSAPQGYTSRSKAVLAGFSLAGAALGATGVLSSWVGVPAATLGGAAGMTLIDQESHPEDGAPAAFGGIVGLGVGLSYALASTGASSTFQAVSGGLTGALTGVGMMALIMAGGF